MLEASAEGRLGSLIKRARALAALDIALRQHLPEPLASHCQLGNVHQGTLVFLVDAPVWKAKLRLHGDILLSAATAAGIPARTLTTKVVDPQPAPRSDAPPPTISARSRQSLRQTAESLDDPELKAILLRLASVPKP